MLSRIRDSGLMMRLALTVAVVIAALCPGALAQAAMPAGSSPDCPGGRCDEQIGCRQTATAQPPTGPATPDAALLSAADLDLVLPPGGTAAPGFEREAPPARWPSPLASRSPPTA
jgi:hypothetical protein